MENKEKKERFQPMPGEVVLKLAAFKTDAGNGMELGVIKKKDYDEAIVVAVGNADEFPISEHIKPGTHFVIPQTAKLMFTWSDGHSYIVLHHRQLRLAVVYDETDEYLESESPELAYKSSYKGKGIR